MNQTIQLALLVDVLWSGQCGKVGRIKQVTEHTLFCWLFAAKVYFGNWTYLVHTGLLTAISLLIYSIICWGIGVCLIFAKGTIHSKLMALWWISHIWLIAVNHDKVRMDISEFVADFVQTNTVNASVDQLWLTLKEKNPEHNGTICFFQNDQLKVQPALNYRTSQKAGKKEKAMI